LKDVPSNKANNPAEPASRHSPERKAKAMETLALFVVGREGRPAGKEAHAKMMPACADVWLRIDQGEVKSLL